MGQIFEGRIQVNDANKWRVGMPLHLLNFYDDARSRIEDKRLSTREQVILEEHCQRIKNGESFLDPDDTVDTVLERLDDHHP